MVKTPLFGLSASPRFFGCHTSVGTLLLLQWLHYFCGCVGNPSLLQEAPHFCMCSLPSVVISSCLWVSPLLWAPRHCRVCFSERLAMTEKARNSKRCRLLSCKITSSLMSIQWQTCPAPSLLVPCGGFLPFPTISAGHFQMGSWLCYFDFIAIEVVGHLPLIPASQSQWKKIPPVLWL